jgi:hypothetical protein
MSFTTLKTFLVDCRTSPFKVWCDGLICSLVNRSENLRVEKGFEIVVSTIAPFFYDALSTI